MPGQRDQILALGHRGAPRHARENDGLRDLGQREALHAGSGGSEGRAHAGHHLHRHAGVVQRLHHLDEGAVERRVTGLQPDDGPVPQGPTGQPVADLLQRHALAVGNLAARRRPACGGLADQRAGKEDGACLRDQVASLDGEQVRITGAGPHEPHGAGPSPVRTFLARPPALPRFGIIPECGRGLPARADHRIGQSGQGCRHGRQYRVRGGRGGAQQGLDQRRDGLVGPLRREGSLCGRRLRLALEP